MLLHQIIASFSYDSFEIIVLLNLVSKYKKKRVDKHKKSVFKQVYVGKCCVDLHVMNKCGTIIDVFLRSL